MCGLTHCSSVQQRLNLTTLEKMDSAINTTLVSLSADSGPTTDRVKMPKVYTKSKINVQGTHMARMEEVAGLPHFKGIDLPFAGEKEVGLLIGQDVPKALMPIEIRKGRTLWSENSFRMVIAWSSEPSEHKKERLESYH